MNSLKIIKSLNKRHITFTNNLPYLKKNYTPKILGYEVENAKIVHISDKNRIIDPILIIKEDSKTYLRDGLLIHPDLDQIKIKLIYRSTSTLGHIHKLYKYKTWTVTKNKSTLE